MQPIWLSKLHLQPLLLQGTVFLYLEFTTFMEAIRFKKILNLLEEDGMVKKWFFKIIVIFLKFIIL